MFNLNADILVLHARNTDEKRKYQVIRDWSDVGYVEGTVPSPVCIMLPRTHIQLIMVHEKVNG